MFIFLIVIAVVVLYIISIYNSLVRCRQQVQEAWSTIDTQLKRRYDLIPNLIETVKGYASHETATLENVIKARNSAIGADGVQGKANAENGLTYALKSIFALSESYPDLKANENFKSLQDELADTETKIQASRQFYNTVVLTLNTKVEMFPSNLIATRFNFKKAEFFKMDEDEAKLAQKAPKVKF
jgi:LemA protein